MDPLPAVKTAVIVDANNNHNTDHNNTHRYTQTHTDTHRYTQTHTDTHNTHRHTQTHTDTHRHTQIHTDTHRYTQTHTDTHRYTDKYRYEKTIGRTTTQAPLHHTHPQGGQSHNNHTCNTHTRNLERSGLRRRCGDEIDDHTGHVGDDRLSHCRHSLFTDERSSWNRSDQSRTRQTNADNNHGQSSLFSQKSILTLSDVAIEYVSGSKCSLRLELLLLSS